MNDPWKELIGKQMDQYADLKYAAVWICIWSDGDEEMIDSVWGREAGAQKRAEEMEQQIADGDSDFDDVTVERYKVNME